MPKIETAKLLADLQRSVELCIKEAKRISKKNIEVLNESPNPETWSALQCIDHLNKYGEYYIPELKNRIKVSNHKPSSAFKPGFIGNIYAKAMLPGATTMQSPSNMEPSKHSLDKSIINDFIAQQKQYLEILKLAEKVNLNKTKVKVTISKLVKLKLGDALRVTIYHNERHILQALKAAKIK